MRDYDPTTGGYIQSDPMGPVPGIGARPELLATTDDYVWTQVGDVLARGLNRSYAYIDDNPLSWVDPRGLWSFKFSAYWGRGGSITLGRDQGQFFGRLGLGVGIGGVASRGARCRFVGDTTQILRGSVIAQRVCPTEHRGLLALRKTSSRVDAPADVSSVSEAG